jgi:hypothetical protein
MTEAAAPKTEDQKPLPQKLAQEGPRAKRSAKPVRRTPEGGWLSIVAISSAEWRNMVIG